MSRVPALLLALALCSATGCFVFDEIDQGREIMKKHSGQYGRAASEPEPEADPEPADGGIGLLARVQQMIRDYREPGPAERDADDEIVRCDFEDSLTYTYESDCLSRGGSIR